MHILIHKEKKPHDFKKNSTSMYICNALVRLMSTALFTQEREEREEIEKEFRAQREGLDMSTLSPSGSNNDNNNGSNEGRDLRTPNSLANLVKEPHPPLGLAGLEAFRREYLTSPLSHLRGGHSLLPPFPPLGQSFSQVKELYVLCCVV